MANVKTLMTPAAQIAPSLSQALNTAWALDTTADPAGWSTDNPAWGQCAVTALVVQDLMGGQLLRCDCLAGSHYWNRLPDGAEFDLTRGQFRDGLIPRNVEERDRRYVTSFPQTRQRYDTLRARGRAILSNEQ